jgi:superoxide dismutase
MEERMISKELMSRVVKAIYLFTMQAMTILYILVYMKANGGGGKPGGALTDKTNADFGSFDAFKAQFTEAAKHVEGIGCAILAYDPL